jgi:hypothetical protein
MANRMAYPSYWDGTRWVPVPPKANTGMPCVTRTGCTILFVIILLVILAATASYLFGSH